MNTIKKTIKAAQATVQIVATIAAITATSQNVLAADTNQSVASSKNELKIVPTLGYTYFNIQGSSFDYKSKGGSSIGALVQMPIMGGQVEIESGLEYLETGAKQTIDFGWLSMDAATLSVGQIAIPVRAKYVFDPAASGTRWYGKAGLTPTYVVSAKVQDNINGGSTDVKSEMNSLGVLTQAGIGADWSHEMIPGRINVDFTYSHGLMKAFKDVDGKSAGFQLQAGYSITL